MYFSKRLTPRPSQLIESADLEREHEEEVLDGLRRHRNGFVALVPVL